MIPKTSGIYKLTNKINGKIYIGKSRNLYVRLRNHRTCKTHCAISRAIQKYGFQNFEIEILADFELYNETELLALEVAYIEFYQSTNSKIGYNLCLFATEKGGIPISQEQKDKLSKAMKGRYDGEKNPFYGQSHSFASRKLISQTHKGKKLSASHIAKMSINVSGENNPSFDSRVYTFKNSKTNECFTGTKLAFYTKFNLHKGNVSQLVLGNQKSVKGWVMSADKTQLLNVAGDKEMDVNPIQFVI